MALSVQPYKGTRDFYPADKKIQDWIFDHVKKVTESYGYQPYDGPMLEPFELYAAKSGDELVNEQLYSFTDRGERKVAMRPEMTPTLARMVAGKIHELPRPIRWYSFPNLWRYERPQRGRLREHWQLNVDVLGGEPLHADAELLSLAYDLFDSFGGAEWFSIRVNNRRLMDHLFQKRLGLEAEGCRKLARLIDAKAKMEPDVYNAKLVELGLSTAQQKDLETFFNSDFEGVLKAFPCEGTAELAALFEKLAILGLDKVVGFDPTIMRGLDYYTGTVFEAYDTSPENRRALFGGGRYDNLVGMFVKQQLSGMGFGLGDVGLRNFLETHGLLPTLGTGVDVLVTLPDAASEAETLKTAQTLRKAGLRVITPLMSDGFGAQLKLADKLGARFVVLLGEEERARGEVGLKDLKARDQKSVKREQLAVAIQSALKAHS